MKSDKERIQFVLAFVETDLSRLSTNQSVALKANLIEFLDWQYAPESWRERELTLPDVAAVQGVVRFTLHQFVLENRRIEDRGFSPLEYLKAQPRERPGGVMVSATVDTQTGEAAGYSFIVSIESGNVVFNVLEPGNVRPRLAGASLKETFLFALGVSLTKVNVRYFRQCPACSKLFLADDDRQMYCSPRCATRERTRRLRAAAREQNQVRQQKEGRKNPQAGTSQKRKTQQRKEI